MRHPGLPILTVSFFLGLAATCVAQDSNRKWREEVDVLLNRWSDDVGASRVLRALDVLDKRLESQPRDGEARLEQARLQMARRIVEKDPHKAAKLKVENYDAAVVSAELAATQLTGQRQLTALAVACVGVRYSLHEEVNARRLIPSTKEESRQFIAQRAERLVERRKTLEQACASQRVPRNEPPPVEEADRERARDLQEAEVGRLKTLASLDALGSFPRPIGELDTSGTPIDLTKYKGKVLLILFWSQAMEPCRELLKAIKPVHETENAKGFEVLLVNLDEKREDVDAFLTEAGITWRQCFEGRGLASKVALAWSVRGIPHGVLLDHTGRVRYVKPWEFDLRLAVQDLLARRG